LFFNFTTELAKWLEPYHNHARPPPSVVLAEAVKQTEKAGKPIKSTEIPPESGNSNGNSKKDEEPPAVTPPPELVTSFFEGTSRSERNNVSLTFKPGRNAKEVHRSC
jgi:N-terminal acetyltransferase B complex non-catalytic subunit